MNKLNLLVIVILLTIFATGVWFYKTNSDSPNYPTNITQKDSVEYENTQDSSLSMYAEENAVIVSNQKPGISVVISKALVNQASYLVIHENENDQPGNIIGVSELLEKDEYDEIEIMLDRPSVSGETLYVMIHQEPDSNTDFDVAVDEPVQSKFGGPILGSFIIDENASDASQMLP